ncbi:hypothetical protein [Modicisalibacter coralii]|uniref:hypothetical protein n=1 Tax=Modicisalibacter coralii TaxID=2304602 RepID=UPI00100AA26E|nr:hypothetical protein [Halomonas coralii]
MYPHRGETAGAGVDSRHRSMLPVPSSLTDSDILRVSGPILVIRGPYVNRNRGKNRRHDGIILIQYRRAFSPHFFTGMKAIAIKDLPGSLITVLKFNRFNQAFFSEAFS